MEQHRESVAKLTARVRSFYERKLTYSIYHGSTNSTRQILLDPSRIIDTSNLCHVLEVDTERAIAIVEPNVPMDLLVRETLRHKLVPPVIPEFPGITVGGAFAGTAGESSSFKYGYFDRAVRSLEIILANGEVTTASPTDDKKDLFNAAAGSYGTMGVLTLLEVELILAKEYVELTYIPVGNAKDTLKTIQASVNVKENPFDFVDGIQFSRDFGVVCVGHMSDIATNVPQHFLGPWDPWFYMHAEYQASTGTREEPLTDTIPLQDYLFRYDRGAFWMGKYYPAFPYTFLNNKISRWLLDSFLHTRVLFQSMHLSNRSQRFIIQDFGLPQSTAEDFLRYIDVQLGIFPLWLCPIRVAPEVNLQRVKGTDVLINIGVWGPASTDFLKFVAQNKALERKASELGGAKWLYAHSYYTLEEFWSVYDRAEYDAIRKKYHAETLPDVYSKIRSKEVECPKQDLKATWHGFWAQILGYDIPYLLSRAPEDQ